jgi:hypothetical protein
MDAETPEVRQRSGRPKEGHITDTSTVRQAPTNQIAWLLR